MLTVYRCLTQDHNLWLVALAGIICCFSAFTAFNLMGRARDTSSAKTRNVWLLTAALATGFGIWSTHFIAMLAFDPGLPLGYDLPLTVASVIIAITITGSGIFTGFWWPGARAAALGGAIVGIGIACMHYTGMAAIRFPGYLQYDPALVVASVVFGAGLAAPAALVWHLKRDFRGLIWATLLLTLAICSMHFTAMGAASLVPVATGEVTQFILSNSLMTVAITFATLSITVLCLVSAFVDQHLSRRNVEEAARLQILTNAATEGIVICRDGKIRQGNAFFESLVGADVAGRDLTDFISVAVYKSALENIARNISRHVETTLTAADGSKISVDLLAREMRSGKLVKQVFVFRDLTERKRSEAHIEFLAHHDALTSLPNRVLFHDRLLHSLARADRAGEPVAVLCLDLDRFKEVNDLYGHSAGDELLVTVAERLCASLRETDTVARLSGDEFAIVQVGIQQPEGANRLALRIRDILSTPLDLQAGEATITASIGIAVYPEDGKTTEDLLRNADTALYRAKGDGRNTHRFFEQSMDQALRDRRQLERDLRASIDNGELYLDYQPQAATRNGDIVGFEALVRWHHPERGKLPPDEFISLAEECGFIVQLGHWVLHEACREAASWEMQLGVAVNLSPNQFQGGNLAEEVKAILDETGLPARRLELEITEGVLMADKERALGILHELKALGVRIAMDDFGTGYSSLSYLQSFPFDKIKIDRSFVRHLEENGDATAIVRAVIGLGHALNLPVVAEGVENEHQLKLLQNENCTEVQGYLIGRPGRIDNFQAYTGGKSIVVESA